MGFDALINDTIKGSILLVAVFIRSSSPACAGASAKSAIDKNYKTAP